MKTIKGNLITMAKEGKFDVIVHGCNCYHVMGGGIARQIKDNFPEAYEADLASPKGDIKKLGTYTKTELGNLTIVNAYTQYSYGYGTRQVDYDAVRKVFKRIRLKFSDKKIAYPMIGAGLGGGNWNTISEIIDDELSGMNHTLVVLER